MSDSDGPPPLLDSSGEEDAPTRPRSPSSEDPETDGDGEFLELLARAMAEATLKGKGKGKGKGKDNGKDKGKGKKGKGKDNGKDMLSRSGGSPPLADPRSAP